MSVLLSALATRGTGTPQSRRQGAHTLIAARSALSASLAGLSFILCLTACSDREEGLALESESGHTAVRSLDADQGTAADHLTAMMACLEDNGWNAVADPVGLGYEVPSVTAENRASFAAAQDACRAEVGPEPTPQTLTQARLEELYAETVAAGECLTALGYSISSPPSRALWLDTWDAGPWTPYADLPELSTEQWRFLNAQCPQP